MAIAAPLPCTYCGSVDHSSDQCTTAPPPVDARAYEWPYRPTWIAVVGLRRQHDREMRNDFARILLTFDQQFERVHKGYEELAKAQNNLAELMDQLNVAMENTRRFVSGRTALGRVVRLYSWLRGRDNPYALKVLP